VCELYCTVLHCTALHCTALHCTTLQRYGGRANCLKGNKVKLQTMAATVATGATRPLGAMQPVHRLQWIQCSGYSALDTVQWIQRTPLQTLLPRALFISCLPQPPGTLYTVQYSVQCADESPPGGGWWLGAPPPCSELPACPSGPRGLRRRAERSQPPGAVYAM
jgi:hypothetical protein